MDIQEIKRLANVIILKCDKTKAADLTHDLNAIKSYARYIIMQTEENWQVGKSVRHVVRMRTEIFSEFEREKKDVENTAAYSKDFKNGILEGLRLAKAIIDETLDGK